MTQEALADVSGLSVRAIRDIERGFTLRPYRHSLERIAAAMRLSEAESNDLIGTVYARSNARRSSPIDRPDNDSTERDAVQQETRYMPAAPATFIGRADIVRRLDELLTCRNSSGSTAALLTGAPGVGKTALALTWAHRVAPHFPDGVVYIEPGHEIHQQPALRRVLCSLGVPDHAVPPAYEDCSALYRTTLAKRRALIILDKAATPDHVRPFLAGSSGCLVLVTSRNAMTGLLVRDGVRRFHVGSLSASESHELFATVVGKERVEREPEVTASLLDLSDHLPLTVRVLAERVRSQPNSSIAEVTARLVGTRSLLSIFETPGDPRSSMRGILSASYDALPAPAARVFTALGGAPRRNVTFAEAAEIVRSRTSAEIDDEILAEALDWLVEASLVETRSPGRYEFNRLIWQFAQEKLGDAGRRITQ